VPPVVVVGIGEVEIAHELAQVAQRGLQEKMKVVGHEDIAVELDGVYREGLAEDLKETLAVGVVLIEVFLFITPTGDVVEGAGILDAEKSGHARLWEEQGDLSTMDPYYSLNLRFFGRVR
jgi:hypothetical protein